MRNHEKGATYADTWLVKTVFIKLRQRILNFMCLRFSLLQHP